MKWFIGIFGLLGLYMLLLYTSTARAQTMPRGVTCEVVRCAPGNVCRDTPRGAVCQPASPAPAAPHVPSSPHLPSGPHMPSGPQSHGDPCRLVKTQTHGHSYYRRVCPGVPETQPRVPQRSENPWFDRAPRRAGPVQPPQPPQSGQYPRRFERPDNPYYKPAPARPRAPSVPAPRDDMMCASIYAPVCAQKQVQCVKAPCPPVEQTFSNSCEAAKAGYRRLHQGTCGSRR